VALEIKTADELVDPEMEARWTARRVDRQTAVLQHILRAFIEDGGPVPVEALRRRIGDGASGSLTDELARLHEHDVILLADGHVRLAYPFSGVPTAFLVVLPGGQQRYACCAIDALGIAAMLGRRIDIRSGCHHCGAPLAFWADAEGPSPEAAEAMVWVGKRAAEQRRVSESL
jgi:hypothetical protein